MLQYLHNENLYKNIHQKIPVARHLFIQLSELEQCTVNEIAQGSKWQQDLTEAVAPLTTPLHPTRSRSRMKIEKGVFKLSYFK